MPLRMEGTNKNKMIAIFRLSAVLYAEDNYNISPQQIHKKVIENALLEMNQDRYVSLIELSEFINTTYQIFFSEDEIWTLGNNPKFRDEVFLTSYVNGERSIALSKSRIETIMSRPAVRHINDYIDEYFAQKGLPVSKKRAIYRFLYTVFTQNTENFKRLVNNPSIELLKSKDLYPDKDRELINNFLNWDNAEKNKAIFNVASFALEYCMLTNGKNATITYETLRNKVFYLDTNIIFRALGINGDLRKKRTLSILKKFNDVGEHLLISNVTDKEFNSSIDYHLQVIRKFDTPNIQSELYLQVVGTNEEFLSFYQEWRRNHNTSSLDMFKAELLVAYENFKKQFKIEVEKFSPYDKTAEDISETLSKYTSEILSYKRFPIESKAKHDAQNVLWIEKKRVKIAQSIFDAKYFLLSSDHRLQNWDYSRAHQVPIVLLPSQWLSIALRFIERSNDDFNSFVNFLNLSYHERLIDNDKLMVVLSGISEYASGYENQEEIYKKFIEQRSIKAIKDLKDDDLYEKAKIFAKSQMELKLEQALNQAAEQKEAADKVIADNHKTLENAEKRRQELQAKVNSMSAEAKDKDAKIEKLTGDLERTNKRYRKIKLLLSIVGWGILALFILILILSVFFFRDCEYNFISKAIEAIDNEGATRQFIVQIIIAGAFGFLIKWVLKKLKTTFDDYMALSA